MQYLQQNLPVMLLVFCRITAFFVVVPVFSFRTVPAVYKVGLAALVSFIVFAATTWEPVPFDSLYLLSIVKELLIGLLLGFTAYLFFTTVQIAGSFVDIQMGFGIANVIDPMTGAQSPILGNLKFIIAMLLFLTFNGHHLLLKAIMDSYRWVPLSNELFAVIYEGEVTAFLTRSFAIVFALAFQIAAPLIVALFLTDVALGLLARTAPQFNVFVVGMPLKIMIGYLLLLFIIGGLLSLFSSLFEQMFLRMAQLLELLGSRPEL